MSYIVNKKIKYKIATKSKIENRKGAIYKIKAVTNRIEGNDKLHMGYTKKEMMLVKAK